MAVCKLPEKLLTAHFHRVENENGQMEFSYSLDNRRLQSEFVQVSTKTKVTEGQCQRNEFYYVALISDSSTITRVAVMFTFLLGELHRRT